jgi:hypothetical protein
MMQPGENRRNHRQNDLVSARLKAVQPIILSLHALFLSIKACSVSDFALTKQFLSIKACSVSDFPNFQAYRSLQPPKCESLCGLQQRFNTWAISHAVPELRFR